MDPHHKKNNSVDINRSPLLVSRVISPEKLAELARTNPKKAKRIIANRKSASKSKERKRFYENELHIQVKSLQSQVDNVSQQLCVTKKDVTTRIAWNSTLRMKIDAKREELHYRQAGSEAWKNEVVKNMANNNPSYHNCEDPTMQSELCLPPLPPSPLPFGQPLNDHHFGSDFVDFNIFDY